MNDWAPINTIQLNAQIPDDVKRAAELLRGNALVALPTETVYGLAAHALNPLAIKKVFLAKNRPAQNPLILHVHDYASAQKLFDIRNDKVAHRLKTLSSLWPGPLTIIAAKAKHIPDEATAGLEQVAVRIPQSLCTLAILRELSFPLVMPSANLSSRPSPTQALHVLKTLDGRIDAVLDGGACEVGIESSVVRIDQEVVEILRPGYFDASFLSALLKEPVEFENKKYQTPQCPGQSFLHYAPSVKEVVLVNQTDFIEAWNTNASLLARQSDFEDFIQKYGQRFGKGISLPLSDDHNIFAQQLYGALYRCEDAPLEKVFIFVPSLDDDNWRAIKDRLKRSSGKC
ncbi:MAG: threonylcarbamoyl-AMP synthase [Myxococcales bacterium]|nr:threonylcarbamoyl-AMP synthase [Myxococcales bacterium]USN50299.1 MAG: threonylcarbamoyl-AMP synthase [Myxococcales bacterium]